MCIGIQSLHSYKGKTKDFNESLPFLDMYRAVTTSYVIIVLEIR